MNKIYIYVYLYWKYPKNINENKSIKSEFLITEGQQVNIFLNAMTFIQLYSNLILKVTIFKLILLQTYGWYIQE